MSVGGSRAFEDDGIRPGDAFGSSLGTVLVASPETLGAPGHGLAAISHRALAQNSIGRIIISSSTTAALSEKPGTSSRGTSGTSATAV